VSRRSGPDDWDRLASAIQHIAGQDGLRNQKGIIHSGSFALTDRLGERLLGDRFLIHRRDADIRELLSRFAAETRPVVLVSPSVTTGVDLPYVFGWQVIAKVPFGDLSDPVVARRRDAIVDGEPFGKRNYDAEAMNTVVQACGRAVRAPDDKGVTFILDGNFWPLYKRAYVPRHFQESFRWLK